MRDQSGNSVGIPPLYSVSIGTFISLFFVAMAPIVLKEIIIFSSEDPRFPAANLLKGQKWQTDPTDVSGKAVVVFQLEKASQIHYIDIGFSNVASLEVSVGRSSWPSSRDHVILLPTVMLQTPLDARSGKNKTGCKMFNYPEHLNSEHANEKWDRVKIQLNLPFSKKKQITLEFVRLATPRNVNLSTAPSQVQLSRDQGASESLWKNSPIAKFADTLGCKRKSSDYLEDKLLRISSTTEDGSGEKGTLSRTAKMVLASRSNGTPTPPKNGASFTSSPPSITKQRSLSSGTPNIHANPSTRAINETTCKNNLKLISYHGNTQNTPNKNGKIFEKKHRIQKSSPKGNVRNHSSPVVEKQDSSGTNTPYRFKKKSLHNLSRESERRSLDSNIPSTSRGYVTPNSTKFKSATSSSVQSVVSNTDKSATVYNVSPNLDNDCEILESESKPGICEDASEFEKDPDTESELTKAEVKKLKTLIQKFFNTLDMEELDPDKITLKELRTSFEAINDVKLDKNGRQYFRSVTASYLELALTCREHKEKGKYHQQTPSRCFSEVNETPGKKRKSSESVTVSSSPVIESHNSPAKMRRVSSHMTRHDSADCEIVSVQLNQDIQCPICMKKFPQSIISDHAAVCGEEMEDGGNDVVVTSVSAPTTMQAFPRETLLDLSDNMRLTEEEKRYWLNFTKQPKAYHPRMDKNLFRGSQLMKCPTCGQFYKSEDIQEHSDDCAEKVNSGLEKRGLYFVKKNSNKIVKRR